MTMLPVPFCMASLKVMSKLAVTAILVALSAGVKVLAVGGVVSTTAAVVKFQAVAPVVPA